MYIAFGNRVLDSNDIKNIIEENTEFKVIKDMSKGSKREDIVAFNLSVSIDMLNEEISESININEEDEGIDKIFNCAKRELNEELNIEYNISYKFLGFIRDISSNTNDHTGIVLYVTADNVSVKEKDSLIGKWMTINEIADNYNKLENWSKYLIDYLLENEI